jgi:hypothetical protein
LRCERENSAGEIFDDGGLELRSVNVGKARRLLGHGTADRFDAVADGDDGGSAGCVQVTASFGGVDETSLTPNSFGIFLEEVPRENGLVGHVRRMFTCARARRQSRAILAEIERGGGAAYCHFNFLTFTVGSGNFSFIFSRASTTM